MSSTLQAITLTIINTIKHALNTVIAHALYNLTELELYDSSRVVHRGTLHDACIYRGDIMELVNEGKLIRINNTWFVWSVL